jgi:peptide/nickel transport system ATP-binding protein
MMGNLGLTEFGGILVGLLMFVSYWRIFQKANKYGWYTLVPFYNGVVWFDIVQFPRWLVIVPILSGLTLPVLFSGADLSGGVQVSLWLLLLSSAVLYVAHSWFLAVALGHGVVFAVGLIALPVVFVPILAFGDSRYIYTFDLDKVKYAVDEHTLLRVDNLRVYFPTFNRDLFRTRGPDVLAVDGVSFSLQRGETLGLVGESGSGKTTIGRSILNAIAPTGGDVSLHVAGDNYTIAIDQHIPDVFLKKVETKLPSFMRPVALSNTRRDMLRDEIQSARKHMQLIFQDPYASLNPRMTVYDIIAEPLIAAGSANNDAMRQKVNDIAQRCKLNVEHLRRFPHAFSGGQRQRIGIARALVTNPEFIVCDESVSALDVSIQAEILNLLADLQQELGVAYLFIAHDLSVVAHISDRVAVLYLGQIVELAPTEALFRSPKHPYTEALMSAIPDIDLDREPDVINLEGEIPSPTNPPSGCRFHTRCRYVQDKCRADAPQLIEHTPNHFASCHFVGDLTLKGIPIPTAEATE